MGIHVTVQKSSRGTGVTNKQLIIIQFYAFIINDAFLSILPTAIKHPSPESVSAVIITMELITIVAYSFFLIYETMFRSQNVIEAQFSPHPTV